MAMLFEHMRVFKDQGGLVDLSLDNQDDTATIAMDLTTSDYLYIGQRLPFTNLFFNVDTVNATAASWVVEYWDGQQWRGVVDKLDATSSSGAILGKTGNLKYTIDTDHSWLEVWDTSKSNAPTELQGIELYNLYWLRLQPSANLDAGTLVKEITYAFTESSELSKFDVEINKFFSAFSATKTDWIDEVITASKLLVLDLRRQGLIVHQGQVIDIDDVFIPATYRALDLIYQHLGPSYNDRRAIVMNEYTKALDLRRFSFDQDSDGKMDRQEIQGQIKRMVR